jgi:hypothetical protein
MEDDYQESTDEIITTSPPLVSEQPVKIVETVPTLTNPDAETVEISEEAKKRVLPYVEPQESKYHHFMFKDSRNTDKLTKVFENSLGHNITVKYGIPQSSPDITLSEGDNVIGKIHLLLCDRRDANKPEKYYIKIYFYQFKDSNVMSMVKEKLITFFENFGIIKKGGVRNKRKHTKYTHKKKVVKSKKSISRITHRKK